MTAATYVRPWLYARQREALFCSERYGICEATTKSGKTVGCLVWLAEQGMAASQPGRNFWWIAPVYGVSRIAYRRMKRALPPAVFSANDSEQSITLGNGSVLWFKSGENADNLYGEDVYAAVIDEASRVREESWHAVRSTLTATRGPVRIIGNVKGRRNWAYQLARRAEEGEPGMHYARITAYDAVAGGILDAREIDDARRTLPENVFRELYEAIPSDDAGNPFGGDAIRACIAPESTRDPVCFGVDLAKSQDWTVVVGLDAQGCVCRLERWQAPWEATIARLVRVVGRVPALVDSTGVGDPVLEALQQRGGPNFIGFKFTGPSKQQLMEGLAVAIQQRHVRFPDGLLPLELDAFEYVYTRGGVLYAAPAGMNDDGVCALALAVWQQRQPQPRPYAAAVGGVRTAYHEYGGR